MENSQEILNELMAISPLLADLQKINIFSVPEGYFSELPFRITNYAILNNTSPVENINKRNLQDVPAGYFDTLSDSILAKVKAAYPEVTSSELHNLSPLLLSLRGENVFPIPKGYFDSLPDLILANIRKSYSENTKGELRSLSPTLYNLRDENVFSVPDGYFDDLPRSILAKVSTTYSENAEDELRNLSPMLYGLRGENVFSVPGGYFESFAEAVSKKLTPPPAKVVPMKNRTSWFKYAAAAIVTGIITITSLQLFKSPSHNNNRITASLPDYIKESFQYKTEADVTAGIAKLDDADIAKYLEKNGSVLDNELLISNTDVSELPSSTDYLIDENALNKYLNKIGSGNDSKTTP
jgi:hypothetical protein